VFNFHVIVICNISVALNILSYANVLLQNHSLTDAFLATFLVPL